jgi:DNA polymerase III subunit alpha
MAFVHLRTHSEFSVVDGTLRVDDAAVAARADGQGALALTDLGNLFGAIKFYRACMSRGVKPILGADVWMEPAVDPVGAATSTDAAAVPNDRAPTRLLLLAQDMRGYLTLCRLLAWAWTKNVHRAQAWVKWSWLEELGEGLIVLSGAEGGVIGQALVSGDMQRARLWATHLGTRFAGRFFFELQRFGAPTNEVHVQRACVLAAQLRLPVVATHPVQYSSPDDHEAHEARVCVAEGETLANPRRVKRFTREQYFKTQAQLEALFADIPSAVANTVAIAKRCNLVLDIGNARLPDFPTPRGQPVEAYFRELSQTGLTKRMANSASSSRSRRS